MTKVEIPGVGKGFKAPGRTQYVHPCARTPSPSMIVMIRPAADETTTPEMGVRWPTSRHVIRRK
jgi:hypothetical protein